MAPLGVHRVSRPHVWELSEVPGLNFGALWVSRGPFRGLLGSILGALGVSWAPWRPFESTRLPNDRPELNFGSILESFWNHFGGQKSDQNSSVFLIDFPIGFLLILEAIWGAVWHHFSVIC